MNDIKGMPSKPHNGMADTSDLNKVSFWFRIGRVTLDVAICATVIGLAFMIDKDKKTGNKTPLNFDVYSLEMHSAAKNITSFYTDSYVGKTMCTGVNVPVGCISLSTLTNSMRTHTGCSTSRIGAVSPMCTQCVETYIHRWYNHTGQGTAVQDNTDSKKLRDELRGCIMRTEGARTVQFREHLNIWSHLILWTGCALTYSVIVTLSDSYGNAPWACVVMLLTAAAPIVLAIALLSLSGTLWTHVIFYLVAQIVVGLLAYAVVLWRLPTEKGERSHEIAHSMFFGIFTVTTAPNIAAIVHATHGWLESDMLKFGVGIMLVIFLLFMLDDLLSVYWAHAGQAATDEVEHQHVHAMVLLFALFLIGSYGITNFPAAPAGDPFSGQLIFIFVIIFLVILALAPVILNEVTEITTGDIHMMKQIAEMLLRLVVITVMFNAYAVGLA